MTGLELWSTGLGSNRYAKGATEMHFCSNVTPVNVGDIFLNRSTAKKNNLTHQNEPAVECAE